MSNRMPGGASVALHLLFNNYVRRITINDLDRSIYAFWHTVLSHNDKLCAKIEKNTHNNQKLEGRKRDTEKQEYCTAL